MFLYNNTKTIILIVFIYNNKIYVSPNTVFLCYSLSEVGKLEIPKIQGKYDTGQLFLHRIFGYRGVILFPWLAQVYDRDLPNSNVKATNVPIADIDSTSDDKPLANANTEVKGKTNTFYQVLIDTRDCPYIVSKTVH